VEGSVPARAIVHQEGVLALLALVGLGLRDGSPLPGLLARGGTIPALAIGAGAGVALAAVGLAARWTAPGRHLEELQARLVGSWTPSEAVSVALISGMAEEALIRALLQPFLGLLPAAVLFAALHIVPDRRAWAWPVVALAFGVALGLLFDRWGYPAAAAAHVTVNLIGLLRLAGHPPEDPAAP
jgi:membrane protease YdiL (CAAX protease family)